MNIQRIVENPCVYSSPNGKSTGRFVAGGTLRISGKRFNPEEWKSEDPPYLGRLLVGFNVGRKPHWKTGDLVRFVRVYLRRARMPEDSSFVYQRGVYTHSEGGYVVTEEGAQVVILKIPYTSWDNLSKDQFVELMNCLGEYLADVMKQKEVIVEISKGGRVEVTRGMSGKHYKSPKG